MKEGKMKAARIWHSLKTEGSKWEKLQGESKQKACSENFFKNKVSLRNKKEFKNERDLRTFAGWG